MLVPETYVPTLIQKGYNVLGTAVTLEANGFHRATSTKKCLENISTAGAKSLSLDLIKKRRGLAAFSERIYMS